LGYGLAGNKGRLFPASASDDPARAPPRLNAAALIVRGTPANDDDDTVGELGPERDDGDGNGYSGGVPYPDGVDTSEIKGDGAGGGTRAIREVGDASARRDAALALGDTLRGCAKGACGGTSGLAARTNDSGRVAWRDGAEAAM